jgi:hypothetical protein
VPERRFGKDAFSWIRLPVSRAYIYPPGRRGLFALGAGLALVVGGLFAVDAFAGRATAVAAGGLTDSHALFGRDCSTCHTPFQGAEDLKCGGCHGRPGEGLARYGWARHYLYRSEDYDRSAATSLETGCAACHAEHKGRERSLRAVADARCLTCHELEGGFEDHPEFDFAAEGTPDQPNLVFPHVLHVREVMEEEELDVVEDACLACHVPTDGGRSFEPISFETSCDACHLGDGRTDPLPVIDGPGPGVYTLDRIRATGGPDALWAFYWDPNEFRSLGPRVAKGPVYHQDPWILFNLRRMRKELYPGTTLADLLRASATLPGAPSAPRALYEEAIATLRRQIEGLAGEPSEDVQEELDRLEGLLDQLESRLDDPLEPLDETRFLVRLADRAPGIESGEIDVEAYRAVIGDLTAECTGCHVVDDATISRVQKDQRTLVRAEFDHRAHVLDASCLDCHTAIPVRDYAFSDEDVPAEVDRAEILNLPALESCQSCHSDDGPAARCTTCHVFHPDRGAGAHLSRTRQGDGP